MINGLLSGKSSVLTAAWAALLVAVSVSAERPNILFIAIDDLRPELGCYGSPVAHSPNLDTLASEGLLFERAYCQQAICSPSRASLMTGMRPDTSGIVENYAFFRDLHPDVVTLSQHFGANGYAAVNCGKIFHRANDDADLSWNQRPARKALAAEGIANQRRGQFADPNNIAAQAQAVKEMTAKYGDIARKGLTSGPAYEAADVPDHFYRDGYNARLAMATMREHFKNQPDQPLFLGLGFYKPHLNFVAPKKYWDLYDREDIQLAKQIHAPVGGAAVGLHPSFELRVRHGIPKYGPIGDDLAKTLLHGYYACVSYIDAQIGMVLDELEALGQRDNTIIVVWGDHGWHLGEMGIWGKATNYEISTRVPLMIWTPDMKANGKHTKALVELVDLYPTLCDLAGLESPSHELEGKSFAPLLTDPEQPWKQATFSQFPAPALREWAANPLSPEMRETFFGPLITDVEQRIIDQQGDSWDRDLFENHLMGYSMRTKDYRLIEWRDHRDKASDPVFVELYDHRSDPTETINVAPSRPGVVAELRVLMLNQIAPAKESH